MLHKNSREQWPGNTSDGERRCKQAHERIEAALTAREIRRHRDNCNTVNAGPDSIQALQAALVLVAANLNHLNERLGQEPHVALGRDKAQC